jgi:hypothetical protein
MITRTKAGEPSAKWPWWGIGGIVTACFILFMSFTDRPPKYESLVASDAQVTRAVYQTRMLTGNAFVRTVNYILHNNWGKKEWEKRDYTHPAFDLDGKPAWIATGFDSQAYPRELRALSVGDKIRVWVWIESGEQHVWQVAYRNQTLLAYDHIVKRDADKRQFYHLFAAGCFLIGLVLVFLKI